MTKKFLLIFKNNMCFENYPPRHCSEKLSKKGEELNIWVGERIRIFGQNIDPCVCFWFLPMACDELPPVAGPTVPISQSPHQIYFFLIIETICADLDSTYARLSKFDDPVTLFTIFRPKSIFLGTVTRLDSGFSQIHVLMRRCIWPDITTLFFNKNQ